MWMNTVMKSIYSCIKIYYLMFCEMNKMKLKRLNRNPVVNIRNIFFRWVKQVLHIYDDYGSAVKDSQWIEIENYVEVYEKNLRRSFKLLVLL